MSWTTPTPCPLSALQHWAYCPRQCGLIHLEQAFDDNLHTQRGQAVHAQVDKPGVEERKGLRIERALPVWSDALGSELEVGDDGRNASTQDFGAYSFPPARAFANRREN